MALNQYTSPSPKPGLIMIAMIILDDAELNILRYSYITKGVMSSRAGTACQVSWVKCQVGACTLPRVLPFGGGARLCHRPAAALTLFPTRGVPVTCCGWALPQPRSVDVKPQRSL